MNYFHGASIIVVVDQRDGANNIDTNAIPPRLPQFTYGKGANVNYTDTKDLIVIFFKKNLLDRKIFTNRSILVPMAYLHLIFLE